jgi:hypothetical protein
LTKPTDAQQQRLNRMAPAHRNRYVKMIRWAGDGMPAPDAREALGMTVGAWKRTAGVRRELGIHFAGSPVPAQRAADEEARRLKQAAQDERDAAVLRAYQRNPDLNYADLGRRFGVSDKTVVRALRAAANARRKAS